MRELKFRKWDETTPCYFNLFLPLNVQEGETVEQYTGLKDKNGKEIYEGDIASEEFEYAGKKTKTIWQVRWCDDDCGFNLHYMSGFDLDDCSLVADDEENIEVVGNIHENPEILEGEESNGE